ncbi:hypothetical protein GPL06_08270 [Bacteroides salyersiae]|uniref:serine/threonine protein kinase n=1 Tax=Bacteroides salyersiae TaxID=291644 RepID=UPI001B8C1EA3|nr:serine/threonine-protein kinase [Bacteroides salyersiae]MBT9872810.1 hypothetical protein [Bacteroides salyersiae]QUT76622.1 Protein kinase domain protein [Bacteroides salyersiae]
MALINGAVIKFTDGKSGIIGKKIGEGGQGEVYYIKYEGKPMALKWYNKCRPSAEFVDNLKKNVSRATPDITFLWPIAVADNEMGVGYVMDLAKPDSKSFTKFIINKYHFKDEFTLIDAAINLCVSFQKLHLRGLAYFDLNDGNFFFDPNTGELQIGDNDNVSSANNNVSNIGGKRGYIAPEVVLGSSPNRYTDFYSLAIILFRLIFIDHPLQGKVMEKFPCLTPKAIEYIFGTNPIFIFDPINKENRATREYSPNALLRWGEAPGFIRTAFVRAFSYECQINPQSRIIESEWIKLLSRWRAYLNICPDCKEETYIEPKDYGKCKVCGQKRPILWMQIDKKEYIPLVAGQTIYESQLGKEGFFTLVAKIVPAKDSSKVLGIRNLSEMDWCVTHGTQKVTVPPGKAFKLCENMSIKFSNIKEVKIRLVSPK